MEAVMSKNSCIWCTSSDLGEGIIPKFVEAVRACWVSLTIWQDKQGGIDWTSLMGNEMKKLLRNLPTHFRTILPTNVCNKVTKLWKVISFCFDGIIVKKIFSALYDIFGSWSPAQQEVLEFSIKVCIPCTFSNCNLLKILACIYTQDLKCMQIHVD